MVYNILIDGENMDAEFGQPVRHTMQFIGKYGCALKKAEDCLKLIDNGFVSVIENNLSKVNKAVYIASKSFTNDGIKVYREELN